MAAFKQHAAFGFWSEKLIREKLGPERSAFSRRAELGMGGRRNPLRGELPPDAEMLRFVREAVALNERAAPGARAKKKPPVKAPPYLAAALKKNAKARAAFASFTPGQQREYVEWLTEAKQEATRERRLATAIEWLAAGKTRNWKYQNC